ncbi:hypothetical protein [Janthinobacterium sp.]|uniref:hypothetical protein n=1 Tax=Janthinobacterium sp. TaxID=1871054 RepID=UPI00289EC181|nr:hypothetical protein [Janthinobacterium sp.]
MLALLLFSATASSHAQLWRPITDTDLKIVAGSPLDFSQLLPAGFAGQHGQIIKGLNGKMVFANKPEERAKLQCASLAWSPATGSFPDHATAIEYVRQLKLHGYNLVRFHYVEGTLMHLRKVDNDFDVEQLDRFHFFLSELKNAGIYWMMDMMSSENGTIGDNEPNRWEGKNDLKFKVHFNAYPEAQQAWRDQVSAIYAAINPYTHQSILSDPALAAVVLVNENSINYLEAQKHATTFREILRPLFNQYLVNVYGNDNAALELNWGQQTGKRLPNENLAEKNFNLPMVGEESNRMRSFQFMINNLEMASFEWMKAYLRAQGYAGLVTSYNNWDRIPTNKTRTVTDFIDSHSYFDVVEAYTPDKSITQKSMLEAPLDILALRLAATRQANKPFTASEYGQVFWNQYRYEASITTPAIAALQGWDYLCMHSEGPVDLSFDQPGILRKQGINPYEAGIDPVLRAGETLSALLFLRGDVKPSPNRATIIYPSPEGEQKHDAGNAVSPDLRLLGLLTAIEISHGEPATSVTGKSVSFAPGLNASWTDNITANITKLTNLKILSASNITNSSTQQYQSDTGELALNATARRFTIRAERTEAISVAAPISDYNMRVLRIKNIDGPALFSASTLDDGNLAVSKKILFILATDALNTGMTFTNANRTTLKSKGQLPVTVRQGKVTTSVRLEHKAAMRLVALDLKGNRRDEIPITSIDTSNGKEWSMTLDNIAPSFGPTTFFLLEEQPAI